MFSLMDIGFGGFQTSIIQFGLDQLHDASESATEITYICTLLSAVTVYRIQLLLSEWKVQNLYSVIHLC